VKPRWGQTLVVFAAAVVFAGGIVVAALARDEPGTTREGAFVNLTGVPLSGSAGGARLSATIGRPTSSTRPPLTVDSGCRPGLGTGAVAAVPEAVTRRVDAAWHRIETWLAAHAPASSAALAGPASLAKLGEVQQRIGVTVPPELVASLLRHDGMGTGGGFLLPSIYRPISVADIGTQSESLCGILTAGQNESVGSWWHGQFVPFAADGAGDVLFLDQRRGHGGELGESDHEGSVDFSRRPATLTDLLEQTATALETGEVTNGYCRAEVTPEGVLQWEFVR
jgi:cell wall assembly regulator SMI1